MKIEHRFVVVVRWMALDEQGLTIDGEYHQSSHLEYDAAVDEGLAYLQRDEVAPGGSRMGDPRVVSFRVEEIWINVEYNTEPVDDLVAAGRLRDSRSVDPPSCDPLTQLVDAAEAIDRLLSQRDEQHERRVIGNANNDPIEVCVDCDVYWPCPFERLRAALAERDSR